MNEHGLLVVSRLGSYRARASSWIELVGCPADTPAVLLTTPGRRRRARLPGRAGAAGRSGQGGCATWPTGSSRTSRASRSARARSTLRYLAADLITYLSLYEGYGNALIEAIFYGKPVVVNRYSVYVADIAPLGLEFIEIDGEITDATVARCAAPSPIRSARPASRRRELRDRLGRRLSYEVLRRACGASLG